MKIREEINNLIQNYSFKNRKKLEEIFKITWADERFVNSMKCVFLVTNTVKNDKKNIIIRNKQTNSFLVFFSIFYIKWILYFKF